MLSTFDSSADFLSTRAHGVFNASTDRAAPNFHAAAAKYNLRHGVPARHLRLSSIQLVRFSRRLLTRIVALSTRPEYAMHSELRAASICAMTAAQWREQRERRDELQTEVVGIEDNIEGLLGAEGLEVAARCHGLLVEVGEEVYAVPGLNGCVTNPTP